MNKYSAVQWSPGGHNCRQGAHMHWQGPKYAGRPTVPPPQDFHFNHWPRDAMHR